MDMVYDWAQETKTSAVGLLNLIEKFIFDDKVPSDEVSCALKRIVADKIVAFQQICVSNRDWQTELTDLADVTPDQLCVTIWEIIVKLMWDLDHYLLNRKES